MEGMLPLLLGTAAFVGTHFLMSHPLRRPLVARLGEGGFSIFYSVVSIATFALMVMAYRGAPLTEPYWAVGDVLWAIATLIMLVASILFAGSFAGNPALPLPDAKKSANQIPSGVFRITRHPMMWSFALWGLVHILIAPRIDNLILCGGIILLALLGSRLQESKKFVTMGDAWLQWRSRTSFAPFGNGFAFPGWGPVLGGALIWLAASWAHGWFGQPAGLFRWL